jgi:transposase
LGPANTGAMERAEAEAILEGDREMAAALLVQAAELIEANRRLEGRIADLEQRLSRDSHNSSPPPSADPPSAPPRPRQAASGRRPGAQPGHAGNCRPLLALEQVAEVVDHWPERCSSCARQFRKDERIEAAAPQRHQVCELPAIAVSVREHRLQRLRCPACAAETRAALPADVPRGAFGPCLQAAVVTLAVRNRVSRRDTTELLRELFGARVASGSVEAIVRRAGEALEAPYAHLHDQLKQAPGVNIDEIGWRTAGERRTLWGLLGARAALFRIAADRHRREAQALLGEDFP